MSDSLTGMSMFDIFYLVVLFILVYRKLTITVEEKQELGSNRNIKVILEKIDDKNRPSKVRLSGILSLEKYEDKVSPGEDPVQSAFVEASFFLIFTYLLLITYLIF